MIASCKCKSKYQDEKYGKGQRVFNPCAAGVVPRKYRCTVCKQEREK